jgi:hypothetical protein
MKKLLLALLMVASTSAFADKFVVEKARAEETSGAPGADTWYVKGIADVSKDLAFDASLQTTQIDVSHKISSRFDVGMNNKFDLVGPVRGYVRSSVGEKISTSGNFTFYAVEPGITAPLGNRLSTQVGFRFRNAFDTANNDTTHTLRAGVTYDITNKDAIGVRFDRMRGDQNQNIWNVNYVRSF